MFKHAVIRLGLATFTSMLLAGGVAHAATFAVDRADDDAPPMAAAPAAAPTCTTALNDCTLRDAINAANAHSTELNTITLPAFAVNVTAALPTITNGLTIAGTNTRSSVIDGGGNTPSVVLLTDAVNDDPVILQDLTIRHLGNATAPAIGIEGIGDSGANNELHPNPSIKLDRVAVTDASATGVVMGVGTLTVDDSLFARDRTVAGAILNIGATITVSNTTIVGNDPAATPAGGSPAPGGGIVNLCQATIRSSTISANTSNSGTPFLGGAPVGANLASLNLATAGLPCADAAMNVSSSIIAGDSVNEDCSGQITDGGHNVSTDFDDSCSFAADSDRTGVDPLLGALRNNGGPTDTKGLLAGSPAIDAGADCATTDQRGMPRPLGTACDSGAFESAFTTAPPVTVPNLSATQTPAPTTLTTTTTVVTPPPPRDRTAPKLKLTGIGHHVTRKAFNAGLKLHLSANEAISADITLLVAPPKVNNAHTQPAWYLSSKTLGRSAKTRIVKLKPPRKVTGRRAVKAQVRIVAYDAAGNRATKTIAFTVVH